MKIKLRLYVVYYREKRNTKEKRDTKNEVIFETSLTARNRKEALDSARNDLEEQYTIVRIVWDRITPF